MVLKEVLENKGYFCRFGGEEMVGILIDGNAIKVAEQYRKAAALIKKADERM